MSSVVKGPEKELAAAGFLQLCHPYWDPVLKGSKSAAHQDFCVRLRAVGLLGLRERLHARSRHLSKRIRI